MKKMITAFAVSAVLMPAVASAQSALEDAREANICDVTAAEYLADGRLKVVCVPGTVNPAYAGAVAAPAAAGAGLVGGTISAGAAAGILAGVVIIGAIAGDDDDTTTTTTTTTSGS